MIILDTNVVSEPTKPRGDARVLRWLDRQAREDLYLTAISLAELKQGAALAADGRRKLSIEHAIMQLTDVFLLHPVLPFDGAAAIAYAMVVSHAKSRQYTLPVADGLIAAIAQAHGCAVATHDVKPFQTAGVAVINPWEE